MPDVKMVLIDPQGSQRGELQAPERIFEQDVNRASRLSFTINQNDPLTQFIEERRSRIKLYREGTLISNLRIWGCKDAAQGADVRLDVSAVDDLFVATQKRTLQTALFIGSTDRAVIVKDLIDTQNARAVSTGIRTDTLALPVLGDATVEWPRDKFVAECFAELADTTGGFEYLVAPIEANSGDTSDLVLASQLGISNLEVFLEFGPGTKESILGFSRPGDADHYGSHTHLLGAGEGALQFRSDVSDDALAIAEGILVDRVFTASDLTNQDLLDEGAAEIASRIVDTRRPLELGVAQSYDKRPFEDYGVGDFVTARIETGRVDLVGSIRIWGWTLTWGSDGQERVTIRIEDEDTGGAV